MSRVICDYCDAPIDLAADPDAVQVGPFTFRVPELEQIICENCREAAWDRAQIKAMEET